MLPQLVALAVGFWGAPACGQPSASVSELEPGTGGLAHVETCSVEVADFVLSDKRLTCEVVLHEVGHLRLGPAFAAENPADPWHALSGPMSAWGANTSICRHWYLTQVRRPGKIHPMKRKKNKPQTAATGGSRVLLAARLATGAGKHSDKRRTTRSADKRRAIQEHS